MEERKKGELKREREKREKGDRDRDKGKKELKIPSSCV